METATASHRTATPQTRSAWNKVPEITLYFWVIKVLCTTVGETVSDYLNATVGLGINKTLLTMGVLLIAALVSQFVAKKYVPALYWIVVVLVSVVGTLITDKLTDDYQVPLEVTTILFGLLLAVVFAAWYWTEKTLSIRTITTPRREAFYWTAILATFAFGTAAGDLLLETLQDNFGTIPAAVPGGEDMSMHPQAALLISGGIFAAVIVLSAVGHLAFKWNAVLMFWVAYIFTRPLGANIGDFLSSDAEHGGIGLGAAIVSGVFLALIVACIVYLTATKRDAQPDPHFIVETKAEHDRHAP